jgi:hypothetical protein
MKRVKYGVIGLFVFVLISCLSTRTSIPKIKYGYFINGRDDDLTGGTSTIKIEDMVFIHERTDQTPIGLKFKITNVSDNSINLLLQNCEFIHGDIRDKLILGSDPWNTSLLGPSNILIEGNYDKYHNWYVETYYPRSRGRADNGNIMGHAPINEPFTLLLYYTVYGDDTKQMISLDFVRVDENGKEIRQ